MGSNYDVALYRECMRRTERCAIIRFLDWQRNVPLVSQSSYPTTTADFGVSMKFSLTR